MMVWAEMAKRHMDGAKIKDEFGDWGRCGRGDVAVDVMRIVGSVLWGNQTSSVPGLKFGERRYNKNLFGRGYTRKTAPRIYHPLDSIVNQTGLIFWPD